MQLKCLGGHWWEGRSPRTCLVSLTPFSSPHGGLESRNRDMMSGMHLLLPPSPAWLAGLWGCWSSPCILLGMAKAGPGPTLKQGPSQAGFSTAPPLDQPLVSLPPLPSHSDQESKGRRAGEGLGALSCPSHGEKPLRSCQSFHALLRRHLFDFQHGQQLAGNLLLKHAR